MTESSGVLVSGNATGAAWVDFDNDGKLDLFVTRFSTNTNLLYRNLGAGMFTNVTEAAKLAESGRSAGASWGDYDNDGFIDLFVPNHETEGQPSFLYRNNGDGSFDKKSLAGVLVGSRNFDSSAWGDFDNDGDIDLFIANATGSAANVLLRNKGDGTFEDATAGPMLTDLGNFQACAWGDYDNDGDLDLFVANYSADSILYRNLEGGTFENASDGGGPAIGSTGRDTVGCAWGDYNNDGFLDLCVVKNGGAVLFYRNNGNGTFSAVSGSPTVSGNAWDCAWGDYDNDGFLDLFVATDQKGRHLFRNNGNETFTKVTISPPPGEATYLGCAWADFDGDGQLDVFAANNKDAPSTLFRNNGTGNHWLDIKCEGITSNRSAIGAKVKVKATIGGVERWQMREISGGGSAGSQNSLIAHFGLGDATIASLVRIEWPSGETREFPDVSVDRLIPFSEAELVISLQPRSQTVEPGANVAFTVEVLGNPPFTYQWRHDGADILGANGTTLQLTSVRPDDDGRYTVVVSNAKTSITSDEAVLVVLDPNADADDDGLNNILESQFGTTTFLADTDGDDLNDYDEIFVYGTDPLLEDSDGDGVNDKIELDAGTDPTLKETRYRYDKIDRLIAVEYENGLSIGYQYDGNGNIVRQAQLGRDQNGNGLSDLWEFLNGFPLTRTAAISPFGDENGDGWSNLQEFQEWKAGSSPTDLNSTPPLASARQTAPITSILPVPASSGSIATNQVRLWDAEGNNSAIEMQWSLDKTTWSDLTLLSLDGKAAGPVAAPPTGTTHEVVWDAGRDLGAGFKSDIWLQARARDVTLPGGWSQAVLYRVDVPAGDLRATNDVATTSEDKAIDIPVFANDKLAGDQKFVTVSSVPNGTVVQVPAGLRYTPRTNFFGTDKFVYSLSSTVDGPKSMATVEVTVTPVNDPPDPLQFPPFETDEEKAITTRWNKARDAEGDLVTLKSAATLSANGGTVSVSGQEVVYTPKANYFGDDSFSYTVEDDGKTSGVSDPKTATGAVTVRVRPVNDGPVLTVPGAQEVDEDAPLVFGGANAINLDDVDAGNGTLKLALSCTNGTLTLGSTAGLGFVSGANNAGSMVLTGTLAAIKSALPGLTYRGKTNFNGTDTITAQADDQGNTGAGGPLAVAGSVAIKVRPVNDVPTVVLSEPVNGLECILGDAVNLVASAQDVEGPIAKVEFYESASKIGDGVLADGAYRASWKPVKAGSYSLTAKATDAENGVGTSAAVQIEIKPPGFVVVELVDPRATATEFSFSLDVTGADGREFKIQGSLDLVTWSDLGTVTNASGRIDFNDRPLTNRHRYYRAVLVLKP
ncbi:MAG: VCBS repeat-containing protein [Verrucomicrobia bacterium]|nr:VCBS repeat-containing protein [Verrucomicrobiota bacterium]